MLSEISQTEKDKYYMISYMWNLKRVELIETGGMVITRGWGVGEMGSCWSKDTSLHL